MTVITSSPTQFGKLLETQAKSLDQLKTIKQLLELSDAIEWADHRKMMEVPKTEDPKKIQVEILDQIKEHVKVSKSSYKLQSDFQEQWNKESAEIAKIAEGMKTFKTLGEKFGDLKAGFSQKYGISNGGLKKTVMQSLNVGGVFNKKIAKQEFFEKQRALGNENVSDKDFEGAYAAAKASKANEVKIKEWQKTTGITDEDKMRKFTAGAELLGSREKLANQYAKFDWAADAASPTPVSRNINALSATDDETKIESDKKADESLELLKTIAENTGGKDKKAEKVKPDEGKGGLLDTIMGFLGDGFLSAFKTLFSPMNILKGLGKVFAIGMIIGALFEGITDAFDAYMETGSISEAIVAGLAGIVDFLTFGLFDKEAIKETIGNIGGWINDHLIQPYINMWKWVGDSLMSLLESIGIPEMKFTIPVINKDVSVGPFYPFKQDGTSGSKSPEAPAPTSAFEVDKKSSQNAEAAMNTSLSNTNTNVVNAPVTTNNNTTQVIRSPIRNQESSQQRYVLSKI